MQANTNLKCVSFFWFRFFIHILKAESEIKNRGSKKKFQSVSAGCHAFTNKVKMTRH